MPISAFNSLILVSSVVAFWALYFSLYARILSFVYTAIAANSSSVIKISKSSCGSVSSLIRCVVEPGGTAWGLLTFGILGFGSRCQIFPSLVLYISFSYITMGEPALSRKGPLDLFLLFSSFGLRCGTGTKLELGDVTGLARGDGRGLTLTDNGVVALTVTGVMALALTGVVALTVTGVALVDDTGVVAQTGGAGVALGDDTGVVA